MARLFTYNKGTYEGGPIATLARLEPMAQAQAATGRTAYIVFGDCGDKCTGYEPCTCSEGRVEALAARSGADPVYESGWCRDSDGDEFVPEELMTAAEVIGNSDIGSIVRVGVIG